MSLEMVAVGKRVRVLGIRAGRKLQARLAALGLVPGVEVEVLRNAAHNTLLVKIKESKVMLGHGMACKIVVG